MVGLVVALIVLASGLCVLAFLLARERNRNENTPYNKELVRQSADLARQIDDTERTHAAELQTVKDLHTSEVNEMRLAQQLAFRELRHELELKYATSRRADRQASNARSRTALVAKIAEHMAPYLAGFPYNPKEARHIGEIVDFIVYEGIEDGPTADVSVVFLEVKTKANGRVSNPREKQVRAAIKAGRVRYEVFVPQVGKEEMAAIAQAENDYDQVAIENAT